MVDSKQSLNIQRKAYLQVGAIISQVNRVEMEINKLISSYYGGNDKFKLLSEDILEDSRMSLSLKLEIFDKVASRLDEDYIKSNTKQDLKTWRTIRNIVAHGVVGEGKGQVFVFYKGKHHALNGKFNEFAHKQESIISYIRYLLEKK